MAFLVSFCIDISAVLTILCSIDGVSENLWSAEGMLCSMEALSLYELDTSANTFTFQGDFDLSEVDLENEVPYESTSSRASTLSLERTFSPQMGEGRQRKRSKSVSPGPPLSRDGTL